MTPALVSVSYVYSPEMNVMVFLAYSLANGSLAFSALALNDFMNMPIVICDLLLQAKRALPHSQRSLTPI